VWTECRPVSQRLGGAGLGLGEARELVVVVGLELGGAPDQPLALGNRRLIARTNRYRTMPRRSEMTRKIKWPGKEEFLKLNPA